MMSAEEQSHPCDLIKPNLGQSILAAAEHLNIIITAVRPNLRAHLPSSEPPMSLSGLKQLLVIPLVKKPDSLSDTGLAHWRVWFFWVSPWSESEMRLCV